MYVPILDRRGPQRRYLVLRAAEEAKLRLKRRPGCLSLWMGVGGNSHPKQPGPLGGQALLRRGAALLSGGSKNDAYYAGLFIEHTLANLGQQRSKLRAIEGNFAGLP
jgi:hypothetical protein